MKIYRRTAVLFAAALMLAVTGCGSKHADISESQVMQLTITPAPTPTPKPVESYPNAAEEKNGITMINQYLIDKEEEGGTVTIEPEPAE